MWEYIIYSVETLLCGDAPHFVVFQTAVINKVFADSASHDSLLFIINMEFQVTTRKQAMAALNTGWICSMQNAGRKVPNIYVVWRTTPDCPDNGKKFAEKWAQAVHLTAGSLSKEMELLEGEGTLERWPARPQEACRRALFIPLCIYFVCFSSYHIFIFSTSSTHYQPNCMLLLLQDCLFQGFLLSPLESFCSFYLYLTNKSQFNVNL